MNDWQNRITSRSERPLGVEVRAALAPAELQPGQAVLEDLLEREELDHAQADRGVEPQPALVGPEGAGELDPEAPVDVDLAPLVLPRHLEDQLALGLAQPLEDLGLQVLRVGGDGRLDAVEDLADGLVELGLGGWEDRRLGVPPGSTTVEIDLTEENGATTLRLVHHGLPPETMPDHQQGWAYFLDILRDTLSTG
jgi:Activator of Hsp90 ATPase homolog 1-like protein